MGNKKINLPFIILVIVTGLFMFLVDIFFSINNWKLMFISTIGIAISIYIIFRINKKEIDCKK